jgi:phosphatidylserine decarboxylase
MPAGTSKKKKFRRSWSNQKKADYNFSTENDIQGIVMLEIHGATDLPRLKNSEPLRFLSFSLGAPR